MTLSIGATAKKNLKQSNDRRAVLNEMLRISINPDHEHTNVPDEDNLYMHSFGNYRVYYEVKDIKKPGEKDLILKGIVKQKGFETRK